MKSKFDIRKVECLGKLNFSKEDTIIETICNIIKKMSIENHILIINKNLGIFYLFDNRKLGYKDFNVFGDIQGVDKEKIQKINNVIYEKFKKGRS